MFSIKSYFSIFSINENKEKSAGNFRSNCRYIIHNQLCDGKNDDRLYSLKAKELTKPVIARLKSKNLFLVIGSFLCNICYDHGKSKLSRNSANHDKIDNQSTDV